MTYKSLYYDLCLPSFAQKEEPHLDGQNFMTDKQETATIEDSNANTQV